MGAQHRAPPTIGGVRDDGTSVTQTHERKSSEFIWFVYDFADVCFTPGDIIRKNEPPAQVRSEGLRPFVVALVVELVESCGGCEIVATAHMNKPYRAEIL